LKSRRDLATVLFTDIVREEIRRWRRDWPILATNEPSRCRMAIA
jgi:hypothetical protein